MPSVHGFDDQKKTKALADKSAPVPLYHKPYAEYFGNEPRTPSCRAGDWLFGCLCHQTAYRSTLQQPCFSSAIPSQSFVIWYDFEVNSFPILLAAILQPTCSFCFVLQHTFRKFVYLGFQPGIELKVDAGICCLSSHRYFCKPSNTEKKA